jgi:3,4-dihydroxy 2-butanone 4-phosphate synthase
MLSTQSSFTLHSTDLEGRIAAALEAVRAGVPVILLDDDDRENEADLIVAADRLTVDTMALMIRECSGIVCLCLTADAVRALELPMMTTQNGSRYGTAFTVSIEAREGVTTGVSAADRVTTIRAATARGAGAGRAHRRLGRPGAAGRAAAGGGAVRADESGRDHDAGRCDRTLRAGARVPDPDDRGADCVAQGNGTKLLGWQALTSTNVIPAQAGIHAGRAGLRRSMFRRRTWSMGPGLRRDDVGEGAGMLAARFRPQNKTAPRRRRFHFMPPAYLASSSFTATRSCSLSVPAAAFRRRPFMMVL